MQKLPVTLDYEVVELRKAIECRKVTFDYEVIKCAAIKCVHNFLYVEKPPETPENTFEIYKGTVTTTSKSESS